jgi:hypothetical protein
VISLINRYFVPVYTSNEDFRASGPAPAEERKELQRIVHETLKAKLSAGTVHVYILKDGHPIDSQHVATAAKVDKLAEMLERTVTKLGLKEGKPIVPATPQSRTPKCESGSLVLHLVARNVTRKGDEDVPVRPKLGDTRSGNWGAYPAEDWIILSETEQRALLPAGDVKVGSSWDLDRDVAAKILVNVYPSTENNDTRKNKIDAQTLKGTVVSVKDGVVRARLDGQLTMQHSFYHKEDGNVVNATLVGFIEFEPGKAIRSLELVTTRATYARMNFGVVVRSVRE